MDIRVLQYFLAVAREGSITSAAEQLHMTQPPLSRQLKDLEDELGVQLFIRGNRKITLTEEGRMLRQRAEEIVTLMEKTKSEIGEIPGSISGELYLGCGESRAISLIARAAKRLHKRYTAAMPRISQKSSIKAFLTSVYLSALQIFQNTTTSSCLAATPGVSS